MPSHEDLVSKLFENRKKTYKMFNTGVTIPEQDERYLKIKMQYKINK